MSLPILVPTVHELPLLGAAVCVRQYRRYLHWRTHLNLGQGRPRVRPKRSLRFIEPTSAEVRSKRLAHWSARSSTLPKPPPLLAAPWRPRTASALCELYRDGEALLKQLLRRRQQTVGVSLQGVNTIASSFDSSTWRVRVDPAQREVFVFMLITMYWRGCRHPAVLYCPALHPPTALIRWIARFTVQQQVDHGRQILDLLTAEEARVHDFAKSVVEHLLHRAVGATCAVALLPDMLRSIEGRVTAPSHTFITFSHEEIDTSDLGCHVRRAKNLML